MKISELISKLQELQNESGDLEVWIPCWEFLRLHKLESAEVLTELDDVLHSCHAPDNDYPLIMLDWS